MKPHRKFFILSASIGSGHSQAARAVAEAIKLRHPCDSARVLDFLSGDSFSLDQLIKKSYLKMLDVFPIITTASTAIRRTAIWETACRACSRGVFAGA